MSSFQNIMFYTGLFLGSSAIVSKLIGMISITEESLALEDAATQEAFNQEHAQMPGRSRHLCIKKDGEIVGFLKGTLHEINTKTTEMTADRIEIKRCLDLSHKIFFETGLDECKKLSESFERLAIDEIIDAGRQDSVFGLEDGLSRSGVLLFQSHNDASDAYGARLSSCLLSRRLISTFPILYRPMVALSTFALLGKGIRCLIKILSNPDKFIDSIKCGSNKNSMIMKNAQQNFSRGLCSTVNPFESFFLDLNGRDQKMYQNLKKIMGNFSPENRFLVCIGASHLSSQNGIVSLFEADGFTVEDDSMDWRESVEELKLMKEEDYLSRLQRLDKIIARKITASTQNMTQPLIMSIDQKDDYSDDEDLSKSTKDLAP